LYQKLIKQELLYHKNGHELDMSKLPYELGCHRSRICRGMHTRTRYNESARYQRRKEEFMIRNKVK
jgi:hypothetical protein